jgi:hypothetical protein
MHGGCVTTNLMKEQNNHDCVTVSMTYATWTNDIESCYTSAKKKKQKEEWTLQNLLHHHPDTSAFSLW